MAGGRTRSNSVKQALDQLEPTRELEGTQARPQKGKQVRAKTNAPAAVPAAVVNSPLVSWLVEPAESFKLVVAVVALWFALEQVVSAPSSNPLTPFLFISYPLGQAPQDGLSNLGSARYGKGPLDLCFLSFYIIVFSFLRQSLTEYTLRPFAKSLGLKSDAKVVRFMEQSYAIVYFTASGALGLYVMSSQDSWWYRTEHLWLQYPHWRMRAELKTYYLLQLSYWLQQMLVLILRLEKPRSDFVELVIHHIVTLWLVGWSYTLNLTMIGTCIFVSMDIPDVFLALSKCINYLDYKRASEVSFVIFLCIWHYMRHYLNIRILYSVWNEFDLIPEHWRSWTETPGHPKGWWLFYEFGSGRLPAWMKYQIFAPILALQLVNTFWSALIWRILFRILSGQEAKDVREEGEDTDEEETEPKKER
ncbi:sphingosine N-acyltransferase lag1 [Microbotryomycetes sp. JL201]|nr:sphingosine N-acyltransferase lag1 [Microbotryomycetes sp. JL201]